VCLTFIKELTVHVSIEWEFFGKISVLFDNTADLCDPQNLCSAKQQVFVFKVQGKVVSVHALKAYGEGISPLVLGFDTTCRSCGC
jgi:hypothetical protein